MRSDKKSRRIQNENKAPRPNAVACSRGCGFASKDQRKIAQHVCKGVPCPDETPTA